MHTLIRFALTSFILLGFLLHLGGQWRIGLLDLIERMSYDLRVNLSLAEDVDPRVVIVDIDERSMAAEGQWPWPRARLAEVVEVLHAHYQVQALALDVTMPEPDAQSVGPVIQRLRQDMPEADPKLRAWLDRLLQEQDGDARLAEVLARHKPVLGMVFKGRLDEDVQQGLLPEPLVRPAAAMPAHYPQASSYTANLPILARATPYSGFFDNPTLDDDGVFRRVPLLQEYADGIYGSLALMTLSRAFGGVLPELEYDVTAGPRTALSIEALRIGDLKVPVDENAAVLVPYRGRQGSFPYVSISDVLHKRVDPAVLEGRIALIGTSAPGLKDSRTTPVGVAYPGVEVHANIIAGILDGRVKHKVPYLLGIEVSILVVISLLMSLLFPRLSPLYGSVLVLATAGALVALSLGLWFGADFVVPLGGPLLFLFILVLVQLNYGYFVESRAKREVSRLFGTYVPPELVSEMAQHVEATEMRSDSREMTVLFSDIRDFTSISEKLPPDELTRLMNEFLTPLTGVIHRHRGTIDKYMGDAVMAFWGAPLADPEHARHALQAAMGMVDVMRRLSGEFKARGLPELKIGVGVNTGVMSVGNMGSEFRRAYTVLGDAVNLGSRLEGLTKTYGVDIICGDTTRRLVDDWVYRDLDRVRVKGKDEPVGIYEPLGLRNALEASARKELQDYRQALVAYRNREWSQAELQFYQLQQREPTRRIYEVYLERIQVFKSAPPPPDWDGVFTHTSK